MGIGDEIMRAGEARRLAAGSDRRYQMLDKRGAPQWHFVWEGNPNIARPGQPHDGVIDMASGKRPYIESATAERYVHKAYRPTPAWMRIGPQAQVFANQARGAVLFHPYIKLRASPNKQWPLESWQKLVSLAPGVRWLQLVEPGFRRLRGVEELPTHNFMDAVGAISGAAALVCHEGALHHAAAAVGTPAIVIRGGYTYGTTEYDGQVNFTVRDDRYPHGCGMRVPCGHCKQAMSEITPERVAAALQEILETKKEAA